MIASVIKRYIWVINLILLAGISYTIAKIATDMIKDAVTPPVSEAFASSKLSPENRLDGNLKHSSPRSSYNVILTKNLDTGKVRGYVEGELIDIVISESVELARIENCIAIVERGEGPETIKCKKDIGGISSVVSQSQPGQIAAPNRIERRDKSSKEKTQTGAENMDVREVSEGVYEVDQKMLEEALSDPNQLMTQARAIPQDDGLKFFAIRPNSVFFKIGLRNGDVLRSINDVKLDNIENAFSIFEELRGQTHFSMDLSRRGQNFTYEYTIK